MKIDRENLSMLDEVSLRKAQSSYSAFQIVLILTSVLSVVAIGMLAFSVATKAGWEGFLEFTLIWNMPLAIGLWKRSPFGNYLGFLYLLPTIPSLLGLILFVMWFRTRIYFGKSKVTVKDVEAARFRTNQSHTNSFSDAATA